MGSLLQFSSRRRMEADASAWLARLDRGLRPGEREELESWLGADVRHAPTLMRLAELWDQLDVMRELSTLFPLPPPRRSLRTFAIASGALAAAVVLGVALKTTLGSGDAPAPVRVAVAPSAPTPPPAAREETLRLAAPVGAVRTESLADGSLVQLNSGTEVRVALGAAERRVTLVHGEALFAVHPDAARPFLVVAGTRTVRAVGTAFNVRYLSDARLEVIVTEGRVVVGSTQGSSGERLVLAGQTAVLVDAAVSVSDTPVEVAAARLAWQRGMLVFDGQPLTEALAEVERHTTLKFEVRDPLLAQLRIGGHYRLGDVDGLLRSLEGNFPIVARRDGDRVIIEPVAAGGPGR